MKTKFTLIKWAARLVLLSTLIYQPSTVHAQGTAFTYQGRLFSSTNPVSGTYNMTFSLFNVNSGGGAMAGPVTTNGVIVTNGLFTVLIDFGSGVFTGETNWLQIGVESNGVSSFTTLTPRQELTPTPYAIFAEGANAAGLSGTIPAATFGGTYSNAVTLNNAGNSFSGNGAGLTAVNAAALNGLNATNFWQTAGNSGTSPTNGNFIGTTDNQPLELHVNRTRSLRLEPTANDSNHSNIVNVVGGSPVNFVASGVVGATIAGGGAVNYYGFSYTNSVTGDFGMVGGGFNNTAVAAATVGGGYGNTASGQYATIGGGYGNIASVSSATVGGGNNNTASNFNATVGGGGGNTASGPYATIGGGDANTASAYFATVCGGFDNIASGQDATVGGGLFNIAAGNNSFAAGYAAQAMHYGSFVWADGSGTFSSTANYQFSVQAAGGVVLAADVQIGTGAGDYHHLTLGGGNSEGFLYGSYPAFSDGIHLGYNFYADAAGTFHINNSGGATSRISASYGEIILAVGPVNTVPNSVTLDATITGVSVYGTFNNFSDRNAKQDFAPVSPSQILDKVAQLPVSEWSYKVDAATRHIGPVAQDFYSVFNIGTDDKHIAPIDEGGVALAAIQGLNQKLNEKDAEIQELKQRLEALEKIVLNQKSN